LLRRSGLCAARNKQLGNQPAKKPTDHYTATIYEPCRVPLGALLDRLRGATYIAVAAGKKPSAKLFDFVPTAG